MSKDLMYKDDTQDLVVDAYGALRSPGGPGTRFYPDRQLAAVPEGAREWSLGVGNPLMHAHLSDGDVVADLGCGSGIDTLLAARRVAPSGRAVGIDLLDRMVERGRGFAAEADIANVEFVRAEMEALPVADSSVDLVISNGSINLSARKSRVLMEAFRILRPGGRLCAADLTIREEDLPPEILTHPAAWAG